MPKLPASMIPKEAKVAYVKREGQTRDHHCHWPGCGRQVPPAMWGCFAHWMKIPKRLRDIIWRAYNPGQERDWSPSREYVTAARAVQDWIAQNYPNDELKKQLEAVEPICVACGDTGNASNGEPCRPCLVYGRIKQ